MRKSPSELQNAVFSIDLLAEQAQIEIPCLRDGSPAPMSEVRPWTKVVGSLGEGTGLHLSWFGWKEMFSFSKQLPTMRKGYLDFQYCPSTAEGLTLQYQTFWFSALLTVKAVPVNCSGKTPYLSFTGLFWPESGRQLPWGMAPGRASVAKALPKPLLQVRSLQISEGACIDYKPFAIVL